MTELLRTHSLFRAVNRRLSDWSVVHSGLNLSTDWLIVRTRYSKPIKTYWPKTYRLHSFLADRDLDTARLGTASLSSAPWRPLTDTDQQRRGPYKEEKKIVTHQTSQSSQGSLRTLKKKSNTPTRSEAEKKIEDTNTRDYSYKSENTKKLKRKHQYFSTRALRSSKKLQESRLVHHLVRQLRQKTVSRLDLAYKCNLRNIEFTNKLSRKNTVQ